VGRPVAVLFDIDHTLAFDNRLELTVLHRMCEELEQNVSGSVNKQKILAHFDKAAAQQFDRIRNGSVRIEVAITEQFKYLAKELPGADFDPHVMATAYVDRVLAECDKYLRVAPGAEALLGDLRRAGYHVGVLSNGWLRLQQRKMELVGYQGQLFVSDDIGYWKPHLKAFEIALAGLPAEANKSLYVGDSPTSDVQGAKQAGMNAAWLNWEGEPYPAGLPRPDYELRHLDELRDILLD
jgi:HAD superfamily hydrolase (TIGR01549 family)